MEWEFNCPSNKCKHDHNKYNLWFNSKDNIYQCWKCKYRGDVYKVVGDYGSKDDVDRLQMILPRTFLSVKKNALDLFTEDIGDENFNCKLPYGFKKLSWDSKTEMYKKALKYLLDRKVDMNLIEKYNIGYTEKGSKKYINRIIFPSYDSNGNLNYFVARSFVGDKPSYTGPNSNQIPKDKIIFNESNINFDLPVYLVEGVFDMVPLYNCVPMLGKFPSKPLLRKLVEHKSRVVICMDEDALKDAIDLYNYLTSFGLDVYFIEVKGDISQYYQDYGKEELIKMMSKYKKLDLDVIMSLKFNLTKNKNQDIDKDRLISDFEKIKKEFKK